MIYKKAAIFRLSLGLGVGLGLLISQPSIAIPYSDKNVRQENAVFGTHPKRIEKRKGTKSLEEYQQEYSSAGQSADQSGDVLLDNPSNQSVNPNNPATTTGQKVKHKAAPNAKSKVKANAGKINTKSKGSGWKVTSTGGVSYENPKNTDYFFKFNGVIRLDQTGYYGSYRDKRNDFPNSGFVRLVETYIESGLGENLFSNIGLTHTGERIVFADTWLGYTGFAINNEVNIGRHSGNWFGLENSCSTSWNPFMERSMQANAFYPGDGVGFLTDWWWKHSAFTLVFTQPDHGANITSLPPNRQPHRSDRWRGIARVTVAPVHETGNVWHFGASFAHRHHDAILGGLPEQTVGFSITPGLRGRSIARVVNTGALNANYANQFNVEFARACGPFIFEAEYTEVFVHRVNALQGPVRFNGWNVQGRFMLSGNPHKYDVRDGAFGSIDIDSPYGAYEIVARYDFIDLNSKDVRGGTQHNAWLGFNWYINQQVRFTVNYIRANMHPRFDQNQRHLDIFGMRIQVRFK